MTMMMMMMMMMMMKKILAGAFTAGCALAVWCAFAVIVGHLAADVLPVRRPMLWWGDYVFLGSVIIPCMGMVLAAFYFIGDLILPQR